MLLSVRREASALPVRVLSTIAAILGLLTVVSLCCAYPTCINNVPTADTIDFRNMLFEVQNCGYPSLLENGSTSAVMIQCGVVSGLEIGVDRYTVDSDSNSYFNSKLALLNETRILPGFAVGVMDVARDCKPTVYGVVSKAIGSVNVHGGILRGPYSHGVMAGVDSEVGSRTWLGVDYVPGEFNHLRVGVSRDLWAGSYVTLSMGSPNSSMSQREVSLTFSTLINLGWDE